MSYETHHILLPKYVFEGNLARFLNVFTAAHGKPKIYIDFRLVSYYIPSAITALTVFVKKWLQDGSEVFFQNHLDNKAFRYLQRIDFFDYLGIKTEEDFNRHDDSGNFVTVKELCASDTKDINSVVEHLVGSIVNKTKCPELYKLLQYAIGEIVMNCCQHSRGCGVVSAQYAPKTDYVRIGISDNGIGIKESFRESDSPHYTKHQDESDTCFLDLALTPEISSKNHDRGPYGDPVNAGVGLSIVEEVIKDTYGHFFIASGSSWAYRDGRKDRVISPLASEMSNPGVVCSLAFRRNEVYKYEDILIDAKRKLGLIPQGNDSYENIFQ